MKDITKYQGVIPAFYACYDRKRKKFQRRCQSLTRHLNLKRSKGCIRWRFIW